MARFEYFIHFYLSYASSLKFPQMLNSHSLLNMHQIDRMRSSATKLATHLAKSPKMDIFHILFYQFTYDKRLLSCKIVINANDDFSTVRKARLTSLTKIY